MLIDKSIEMYVDLENWNDPAGIAVMLLLFNSKAKDTAVEKLKESKEMDAIIPFSVKSIETFSTNG